MTTNHVRSELEMDPDVASYLAAIPPAHRPLFDRVHRLILEVCPDAEVTMAYKMPTYQVAKRRLHLASWKHGVSIYCRKARGDGGLTRRHPELRTSTGTLRLRADRASNISDDEIRSLVRSALAP